MRPSLVLVSAAAIVAAHLYVGRSAGVILEKLAQSFGMKLSGCVHSLKKLPKTQFEGNPTLRFGYRIFFIYFWRPPEGRETTVF